MHLCAWNESNPDVGSSRNNASGSPTISTPIFTRFRSPPDTPRGNPPGDPTALVRTLCNPNSPMIPVTAASTSSLVKLALRNEQCNVSVSSTVMNGNNNSSCMTYAVFSRANASSRASPFTRTSPRTTPPSGVRPDSAFSRDVFPLPVGPMSASTSPDAPRPRRRAGSPCRRRHPPGPCIEDVPT